VADFDVRLAAIQGELDKEGLVRLPLVVVDDGDVEWEEALVLDHGNHLVDFVVVLARLRSAVDGFHAERDLLVQLAIPEVCSQEKNNI